MIGRRAAQGLVAALAAASACAKPEASPAQKALELGPHRLQVSAPAGWDVLDQGARKRFRRGEAEIVLETLGHLDWDEALASLHDDNRREVKSRRAITIDQHDAVDIETWNRLDHTWPQRQLFVRADEDVLALHMTRTADADTLKAYESIRDSLHFVPSARR
jgi:hypothetical protein